MDWIKEFSRSFNYWSGVPVLAVMVAVGVKYVRYRKNIIKEDWEFIGHIKHIYIYPIEGAYRKEVKVVDCSKHGLLSSRDSNNRLWKDRHYVIYSEPPPREELDDSEEETTRSKKHKKGKKEEEDKVGVINLHNSKFVTLNTKILDMVEESNVNVVEYPDGTSTFVRDCGDQIASILSNIPEENVGLRMGHQSNKAKLKVFDMRKFDKNDPERNYNHLKLEFSKFVLVNERSVEDVKTMSKCNEITPANFRPHFVIEADKYCEDKFEYLKIGTVKFYDVIPCAVGEHINIHPETGHVSDNRQPFLSLSNQRKLKTVRPDITLSSGRPVFGITFDILPNNPKRKIAVGDAVYAKKLR